MSHSLVHRTACALILALAATAAPAQKSVGVLTELVARTYCAESDGTPHLKRVEFVQPIYERTLLEPPLLLAGYGAIPNPDRGLVKSIVATATLVGADGSERPLGTLRAKVSRNGQADVVVVSPESFRPGDLLHWQLQFRGGPRMVAGECFLAAVGHSGLPADAGLAALTQTLRHAGQ